MRQQLLETGKTPEQLNAVVPPAAHSEGGQPEPLGFGDNVIGPHDQGIEAKVVGVIPDPGGERTVLGLCGIDHRNELDVRRSERDYPVGRPVPGVPASCDRSKAVLREVPIPSAVEVRNARDEVVYGQCHRSDRTIGSVKRFSPLLLAAAIVALIAVVRRSEDPLPEKVWTPVEPS